MNVRETGIQLNVPTSLTRDPNHQVVYYEQIKRDLNRRLMYEYRCDERLKGKSEGSTRLAYRDRVSRGTGTPKDRYEINRREVCD